MSLSMQQSLMQEIVVDAVFSPPFILDELYAASASKRNSSDPPFFTNIRDWIHQQGGAFHPHQTLGYDEKFNGWILFAAEDIDEGQVLSHVPWQLLIGDPIMTSSILDSNATLDTFLENISGFLDCEATNKLMIELELGSSSIYAPYTLYLKELQSSSLPATWSEQGQRILNDMLGGLDAGDLPPLGPLQLLDDSWFQECSGAEEGVDAAELLLQRGLWSALMVPTVDWYTHRNGAYLNVQVQLVPGQFIEVTALRPISKGEPLHRSLDLCALCNDEAVESGYGTPELFRDYGFVEAYPQRWSFQPNAVLVGNEEVGQQLYVPQRINFDLVEDTKSGSINVHWSDDLQFNDRARNYVRRVFRQHLRKLYRFHNVQHNLEEESSGLPEKERVKLMDFYDTIRNALQYAINSLENEGDGSGSECQEHMSSNEGACNAPHVDVHGWHYDDLKWEEDDIDYIYPTCASTQILDFHNYDMIEELQTNYQKLWFVGRERDNDVCMNLENTLQICSSYRPHYHEFFVHFPARFLDKVERVIFIGGGDSMLLHEVLKYPTLEKVVGLELDQQVTRKSFKHFQSQPHWDNDKVEWWYGDATKSLPLLPRDYWASFDLVLVDLSETVMSFSVTKTMDIFSALSLLLKPEGIMIKNEPYLDQFSDFFDYSIHVFYGTPKICTQVLVMGSNQVDFLHHPTKEHQVERLLLEPLDHDESLRFKYMHDYRKTDAREQGKCSDFDHNSGGSLSVEHGAYAAGLIEILEAEQISFDVTTDHIETLLFNVAKDQGLNPLSPPMIDSNNVNTVMVMKEGYIAARVAHQYKHIAFDIHLWGAFVKMESLRSALLQAVGANRSSFYRVVAGGMYGTSTWESDRDFIGIKVAPSRNCAKKETPAVFNATPLEDARRMALTAALRESVRFLPSDKKKPIHAVVLCGFEGSDECASSEILQSNLIDANVKVQTVWTCPELRNQSGLSMDSIGDMYGCEMKMIRSMLEFTEEATDDEGTVMGDIDMIILDPSTPLRVGQILNSILSVKSNRESFISDQNILLTFSSNSDERSWHQNVVERYRKASHFFPVSRATVMLSTVGDTDGDHTLMGIDLAVVNDVLFFQHLKDMEQSLQVSLITHSKVFDNIEATTITGGMLYYDSEYDSREFPREAYDVQPALQQQSEQIPLGRQGIFQFELVHDDTTLLTPSRSTLSIETLNNSLQHTLETCLGVTGASIRQWSTSTVGEGVAVVIIFPKGSLVSIWDGRHHVDVNLYTISDQSQATADHFVDTFADMTGLTKTLRDDQPRGPGRVVQFQHELSA